jgi:hypothetical protein
LPILRGSLEILAQGTGRKEVQTATQEHSCDC